MQRLPNGRYLPADSSQMVRLKAAGLTAREIGDRVGMSKNAVVGRLWRAAQREPVPVAWQPPKPEGCRWIEGEPWRSEWSWCGAPIASPARGYWCAAHRKRVYLPFKPGMKL